jgi:hypothetical protein
MGTAEKEEINISLWDTVLLRNGEIVRISNYSENTLFPWIGIFLSDDDADDLPYSVAWTTEGRYLLSEENELDIVKIISKEENPEYFL